MGELRPLQCSRVSLELRNPNKSSVSLIGPGCTSKKEREKTKNQCIDSISFFSFLFFFFFILLLYNIFVSFSSIFHYEVLFFFCFFFVFLFLVIALSLL